MISNDRRATTLGALAILVWSANIAFSRHAAEALGAARTGALVFLGAGLLGVAAVAARGRLGVLLRLPRAYLLGCGGLFVAYMLCLYPAIGLSVSRAQAIEVGVLNYLWPGLTLAFAVPVLGLRPRPWFAAGVLLCLLGAALAPLDPAHLSLGALAARVAAHPLPYALGLGAGVTWALYSVLARRLGPSGDDDGVPLFALAAGLALLGLGGLVPAPPPRWDARAVAEVAFLAAVPGWLAYSFWDRGMRNGDPTLLAALSNVIPVLSTAVSAVILGVVPGWPVWAAAGLVVAGAVVCQLNANANANANADADADGREPR